MGATRLPLYPPCPKKLASIISTIFCAMIFSAARQADPFIPQNDNYQVITLPAHIIDLHRQIQHDTATNPSSSRSSSELHADIMTTYRVAVRDNSARAYGRVLSLIAQWPNDAPQPVDVRNIHASVLQHYHEFNRALEIINNAVDDSASNLTTQLIRFQIAMVSGDYSLARTACNDIASLDIQAETLNCQSQLQAATGQLSEARDNLQTFISSNSQSININQLFELLLTAGDIAARQGQADAAETFFTDALRINPSHQYLRLQYIDLLLTNERYEDTARFIATIPDQHINNELRILYIRAINNLNLPDSQEMIATLTSEITSDFQEALQRQERLPYKEMALFYYYIETEPTNAVTHAYNNWQAQKEISDTLLLYRSALAANDQEVINEVESWINRVGVEDARLQALNTSMAEDSR